MCIDNFGANNTTAINKINIIGGGLDIYSYDLLNKIVALKKN
jgi:hypothetical protein